MNNTNNLINKLKQVNEAVNEDWRDSLSNAMTNYQKDSERFDNPRIARFDNIISDISEVTGIKLDIDDKDIDNRIGAFIGKLIKICKECNKDLYEEALEYLK